MGDGTANRQEEYPSTIDPFDLFVVDDSPEGIDEQAIAEGELLVDELVAEWSELVAGGDASHGSGFAEGVDSGIGAELDRQFIEDQRTAQSERRLHFVSELTLALERGCVTETDLLDMMPNGVSTEEAFAEIILHLEALGVVVSDSVPEQGSPPLETEFYGNQEDLDDVAAIAESIGSCSPIYRPRVGWLINPHDPLRAFVHDITAKPLLSRYEEISLGRRVLEALRPVAQLVEDHPVILTWPEVLRTTGIPSVHQQRTDGSAKEDEDATGLDQIGSKALERQNAERIAPPSCNGVPSDLWTLARAIRNSSVASCSQDRLCTVASELVGSALAAAEAIRNRFADANFKLVFSIATKYCGRGLEMSDLVQEGCLGLLRGIEKWDPNMGWKLSTYATWWIRQSISRALADKGTEIRIPVHMMEKINQAYATQRGLEDKLGRKPSGAELANALNIDGPTLTRILKSKKDMIDITALDLGSTWDVMDDSAILYAMQGDMKAQIDSVLDSLEDREAEIVRLRFGIGGGEELTLEEVGKEFGVTRERIRQIEKKALMKLAHPNRATDLRVLWEL